MIGINTKKSNYNYFQRGYKLMLGDEIMDIYVCIGSSCHLKGSYDIIELLKENIALHKLENSVNMRASFCLGKCTTGVSIKVDDDIITGVSKENFDDVFKKYILKVE